MRSLLLILIAASGVGTGLSGCTDCEPLLDVRQCLPGSTACAPKTGAPTVTWNETASQDWPEVHDLLLSTKPGEHDHAPVTEDQEQEWWTYWGVDPSTAEKELFAEYEGGLYRIRILSCE